MIANEIYEYLDQQADFSAQESWDNSGFLIGDRQQEVTAIGVSLDITREVVDAAKKRGIQLLVSHHPVIFKAQKGFFQGQPAFELAASGISAICAHTNFDAAQGGITDALAKQMGLTGQYLAENAPELLSLRFCDFSEPVRSHSLAQWVKQALGADAVRCTCSNRTLKKIALCGGAGATFWQAAKEQGADALVTGDGGYHDFLDAEEAGFTLIAAGHYHTEQPGVRGLFELLSSAFPTLSVELLPQKRPIMDL